ncbi:hypothetical protein L3X38_045177 [Prunus dulcis]|uniref:Uncharacterized protein n=1 Tax=Prunus dulcis TaxID=3755 RepID=A0AAD4V1I3_PRUDU|nr:hypothetical protein L3X38_045177 [Prunus dulcis]
MPSGAFHQTVCGQFVEVNIFASNDKFQVCNLASTWICPSASNNKEVESLEHIFDNTYSTTVCQHFSLSFFSLPTNLTDYI